MAHHLSGPSGKPRIGRELGRGAEGIVYENLDSPGWVVKEFYKGGTSPFQARNEYHNLGNARALPGRAQNVVGALPPADPQQGYLVKEQVLPTEVPENLAEKCRCFTTSPPHPGCGEQLDVGHDRGQLNAAVDPCRVTPFRRECEEEARIMDPLNSFRATAQELVAYAQDHGVDLNQVRNDFTFRKDRRWIDVWRKDRLSGTGPVDEPVGTLHYNMQGAIAVVPSALKESAGAFRGAWSEAGTFKSLAQAFALVSAWLLERKEVDDLPARTVRRYGI